MKPGKCITYFCMILLSALRCSNLTQVSGIEITNGNCMGKIYDSDGAVADSALVRLIHSDYNPYSQTNTSIDSTYTNAHGNYAFMVSEPNYYNVVAEKGSMSCMQDSIFVQADAKTVLDNDTLGEAGTLSGIVRLKPGDDNSRVVILVLGTNVYTVPSDTSGRFSTSLLPKGDYTIQIFTTLSGYAVFDTNVTIKEGSPTELDVILPSANAPSLTKLTAFCDSSTMFVSLSWPMPDTSKIVSYVLYRKSRFGRDTMWVLSKSAHSFVDDVVGFEGDSISYQIACIGKNYKEGYRTATQPIVVCGKIYCIKKIDLSRIAAGLTNIGYPSVFSDRENEIFLAGQKGIFKLDSNGVVQKDYLLDISDTNQLSGYLQSDDFGHLYIFKGYDDHPVIIKFDRDLNVLAETELNLGPGYGRSIEVSDNGTIYVFSLATDTAENPQPYCTDVKVLDSAYTVLKDFHILNRQIFAANHLGDTIVTIEYPIDDPQPDLQPWFINFYDTAFTLLSVFATVDFSKSAWGNPRFNNFVCDGGFIAVPNGIFVALFSNANADSALFIFSDSKGMLLARSALSAYYGFIPAFYSNSFDSRGNFYVITYKYTCIDDMPDNHMTALSIYTMGPLLK
jgi:hypothetical protein